MTNNNLKGLITIKDIEKIKKYPNACKDLWDVCASELPWEFLNRGGGKGGGFDDAGVDVIVVDTSHGHSAGCWMPIRDIKQNFTKCELIAGNVATKEGADGTH